MINKRPYKFTTNTVSMILSVIIVVLSMLFILFLNVEIKSMENEAVPAISTNTNEDNSYSFQNTQYDINKAC